VAEPGEIAVEVAYALPERQRILALKVPAGTTMLDAVERSGIARLFEGLDLANARMGIFGKAVADPRVQVLADGERVSRSIRPLACRPEGRRARRVRARPRQLGRPRTEPASGFVRLGGWRLGCLGRLAGRRERNRRRCA
jgi:putative ubiquitin-RnfH superfamily antitoxin RatB of RatAB toxin-antitoxin module